MKVAALAVLITALSVASAIPDLATYLEYIESVALNKSFVDKYTEFADQRRQLYEQKVFPDGNSLLGEPKYSCPSIGAKSTSVPDNVNALRVNDINVMAAMGDSLTAGFGAGAHSLVELTLEYRGLAFPIGGDGDLKYSATLPNIVNQYSPLVVGASTRVAPVWYKSFSQLNVAVSGARADNLTSQAHELVKRMKADKRINMNDDWKLVTVFVGSNDLCHYCEDTARYAPAQYKASIKAAIDVLQAELPRTLVQVISPSLVKQLRAVNKVSSYCEQMHKVACPCVGSPTVDAIQKEYNQMSHSLEKDYVGHNNFAVVTQTFLEQTQLPTDSSSTPDVSFFAPDCFHFSHWGHALVSKGLFNNMMEPVGSKANAYDTMKLSLACPDEACPLIRTPANSDNCGKYTAQTSKLNLNSFAVKPAVFAASDVGQLPAQQINVVDRRNNSFALICIGLSLGMIVGLIVGSLLYNGTCSRSVMLTPIINEKTPLLAARQGGKMMQHNDDANYVQIY